MSLASLPLHLLVTSSLLALLVAVFLVFFLIPGILQIFQLNKILAVVETFQALAPPAEFKKLFSSDKRLAHLWSEYQETLHIQREERDGQTKVTAVRSTIPADHYFNGQFVIDSHLHTEFFKHLPGIFTGLGIIGTFTGLIDGLHHFQVSENAATVRSSLESLMHAVGDAFLISAAAITAAMAVTLLEKLLLAILYRKTEALAQSIDACFESGAGEDYLLRMVRASEALVNQSMLFKDALVKELSEVLVKLSEAQIASAKENNIKLGNVLAETIGIIAETIQRSLKDPMDKMATFVEKTASDAPSKPVSPPVREVKLEDFSKGL
jgi:hypothetical protein